jgi:Carboxypeptidase regulatory-like domain
VVSTSSRIGNDSHVCCGKAVRKQIASMSDLRRVRSSQLPPAGECGSVYKNADRHRRREMVPNTLVRRCRMSLTLTSAHLLKGILILFLFCWSVIANAEAIHGHVIDPQSAPVDQAHIELLNPAGNQIAETSSNTQGDFSLQDIASGVYLLTVESPSFLSVTAKVSIAAGHEAEINVQFRQIASVSQQVTIVASARSSFTPDPAQSVIVHDQVLDANPGRPGAPISIPGLPIETASGGIKAPQYFAPGVAGDHGEPIAQFYQIGDFLYPNNLPANAHGNGYADPNFLIASTIEGVRIDGAAFDVREGNNSVDLAASYLPRQRLTSFLQLTGDYRDADLMGVWGPANPQTDAWIGAEFSFGNGFLKRPEHRQQFKLNGFRQFHPGRHELTLFGAGYYGFSFLPGLIPIDVHVPRDTVDDRQLDRTSTFLAVATDSLKLSEQRQMSFSGFYRNYALTLRSYFGDGLIQQQESRNVVGGESTYLQSMRPWLVLFAGVDLRRDAPRNLDLKHLDDQGVFQPVTNNNLTLSFLEPFLSLDGPLTRYCHYDVGFRQEQVRMDNLDLINPASSFNKLAILTLPKATLTIPSPEGKHLPQLAFSYGEAFHTNDPRIGIGNGAGESTLVATSRAYQLVASQTVKQFQFYLILRRMSNSLELAKIDPDTGLQESVGPSLNKAITASVQRSFSHGALFVSYSQADARDRESGEPVPEAPRAIWDAVGSLNRLPLQLQARGELEFVKAKPLGHGFTGVPVTELRGTVARSFLEGRMSLAANFLIARGFTGQTTEVLALPTEPEPFERIVGVPLKSYLSLSFAYSFKK